jgi:hypothetical protein
VTSETKFFAIVFQGNPCRALAGLGARADQLRQRRVQFFCMCAQHGRCRKLHLGKLWEREKYDTPPAAQQRNNLLKKEKPGEAGL